TRLMPICSGAPRTPPGMGNCLVFWRIAEKKRTTEAQRTQRQKHTERYRWFAKPGEFPCFALCSLCPLWFVPLTRSHPRFRAFDCRVDTPNGCALGVVSRADRNGVDVLVLVGRLALAFAL